MAEQEVVIRRYRAEDREAVFALYERVRNHSMGAAERALWSWQFERNPHHPPDGLLYWVMEGPGGLAGQMGTMPIRLQIDGHVYPSAWGVDLMVDPAYRGQGLALKMLLHWTQSLEVTLGKGIADIAYHLATNRLSWRDIGPNYRHLKLVNPKRALGGEFSHPILNRVGGLAGGILDRALTRSRGESDGIEVREPAFFGGEADTLWESLREAFPLTPIRDRTYLTWRYGEHPSHTYRVLLRWRGDRPAGLFVVRSFVDPRGRRAGQIVEPLVHPEDADTLEALVAGTLELLRPEGVDYLVTMVTDRGLQKLLSRQGFLRRRAPETRLIGEFGRLPLQPSRVLAAENWLVTLGDADTVIT